jgi:hypothetical protein
MLSKDFKEFAELLHSNGAEYLIVGGYALAAYGHPRYTGDLDFWVGCDAGNAARVMKALEQFGLGSLGVTQADLTKPQQIIQLGYPPGRIDLITTIDGVEFADCYARRVDLEFSGLRLHFISEDDFKRNKRASGRYKDLADLESLGENPESGADR